MKQSRRSRQLFLFVTFFSIITVYLSGLLVFYSSWLWRNGPGLVLLIVISPAVIGVLAFILVTFLRLNRDTEFIKRTPKIVIFTVLPFAILASFFTAGSLIKQKYNNFYTFTREKWAETPREERFHLIPSLEKTQNLIGKDYDGVLYLLGAPDDEGINSLSYDLGYGRGIINIDPLYYYITFDEKLIVIIADTYQS